MPDIGELVGHAVEFLGAQVGDSSLRLGPIPALTIFLVLLVLLSLVARPSTRWTTRDLGRLAGVPRAMALAAESGAAAAFSLGSAGIGRAVSAFDRLQTLAALPILAHVARAAARGGVPLLITTNDAVAAELAESVLADAHAQTDTEERAARSSVAYLGEGRAVSAAAAMAAHDGASAQIVAGHLAEEGLLLLVGAVDGAAWSSVGTASAAQAPSVLLTGDGTLIGPELFQAPSDLRAAGHDRTGVLAMNRLLLGAVTVVLIGSAVAVVSGADVAGVLAGR